MAEFSGSREGRGRRFALVASRFNETITQKLVDGAMDAPASLRYSSIFTASVTVISTIT